MSETYQVRWTTQADLVATVTADTEEEALDIAVREVMERLDQVAATINGVAVYADIDGMEPDEVARVGDPA